MKALSNLLLSLNRTLVRLRHPRVPAANLLLLCPHCLHRNACERPVRDDIDTCARCGQCPIGDLLALRDKFGIQCCLAGGGGQALVVARDRSVKAIVAVACERELADGIRAIFPKPVIAVPNQCPHGPCKDTLVDVDTVERVIRETLLAQSI